MVAMQVVINLPGTRHLFLSSFEALLEPQSWRFTVQNIVDEIHRTASVDISAFHDGLYAFSSIAGGFSIPNNRQGSVQLSLWIPASANHTGDTEAEVNQSQINMALEYTFHESFNGRRCFGAVPSTMKPTDKLSTFIVREEDGDDEDGAVRDISCAVCLEDIAPGDKASAMPCSHVYHDGCIRRWLGASRLCPLCRFALE